MIHKRHEQEEQTLMADLLLLASPDATQEATPKLFRGKGREIDLGVSAPDTRAPRKSEKRRGKDTGHEPNS